MRHFVLISNDPKRATNSFTDIPPCPSGVVKSRGWLLQRSSLTVPPRIIPHVYPHCKGTYHEHTLTHV